VPGQPALQVQISTTLAAVSEGAAETAVQDENLTASPAIVKLVQQPRRRDARTRQVRLKGIDGGEVKPATPVQHTVTRQVHHHQVTDATAGQEHIDLPPQLPLVLVDHPGDGEGAHVRVAQERGQVVSVAGRCPQLAKLWILVAGGGDDQGRPRPFWRVRSRPGAGRASHR
jgi:hypothetical protein